MSDNSFSIPTEANSVCLKLADAMVKLFSSSTVKCKECGDWLITIPSTGLVYYILSALLFIITLQCDKYQGVECTNPCAQNSMGFQSPELYYLCICLDMHDVTVLKFVLFSCS